MDRNPEAQLVLTAIEEIGQLFKHLEGLNFAHGGFVPPGFTPPVILTGCHHKE